ncbi:pyridoxal-dependent decarboxylase [Pectobacterium sp. B1J-3]|uniref:pyridoxal-dependent decarboxylase n=1 Tax=Pectobacterium sp. B1J-3 TaxID=3385371 RepID=UPI0039063929
MSGELRNDVDESLFTLSENGLSVAEREKALLALDEYVERKRNKFSGYQTSQICHYSSEFSKYLDLQLNNVGDPFVSGNLKVNSKFVERAVLDYFAKLWHAPERNTSRPEEAYWGYLLSMGSTEGNLYALRNARDYLAGKVLWVDKNLSHSNSQLTPCVVENKNALKPVLFYSEDTHYSIDKAKDILLLPTFAEVGESLYPGECPIKTADGKWPKKVPSQSTGSVDIDKLSVLVEFFTSRGFPIVVNFNYGTTFKGALDNVSGAIDLLLPILSKYGLNERTLDVVLEDGKVVKSVRNGYWFHIDGALGAAYVPFLEKAKAQGLDIGVGDLPSFDFRNPVHSIVTSGHKNIGTPWPSGVYLTKQKYLLSFSTVNYIGAQDSTLAGSRNGFSALLFWLYLSKNSYDVQMNKIVHQLKVSEDFYQRLKRLGNKLGINLYMQRSPLSLSILFLCPNNDIVEEFSLSTQTENGINYAHVFAMEHLTEDVVEQLFERLSQLGAFDQNKKMGGLRPVTADEIEFQS